MKKVIFLTFALIVTVIFSLPVEYSEYFKSISKISLSGEILWNSPRIFLELKPGESVEFNVSAKESGYWNLRMDYQVLSEQVFPPEVSIKINNEYPFLQAQSIPLLQYWEYDTYNFPKNRFGDEMVPTQHVVNQPVSYVLEEPTKIYKYPLLFRLKQGENRVKITVNSGKIRLLKVSFERPKALKKYVKNVKNEKYVSTTLIKIDAEKPYMKSETSINSTSMRDVSVLPYDTYKLFLNTFGGNSWAYPGQTVVYEFNVKRDGYYKIAFKYKQDLKPNSVSFRTIKIDGNILFEGLEAVRFPYTDKWKIENIKVINENSSIDDAYFYFRKGSHTIEISVSASVYQDVLLSLREIMDYVSDLALRIKYITGGESDKLTEWEIRDYFPDIDKVLNGFINKLEKIKKDIRNINGNSSTSEYISIDVAEIILKRLAKNVNAIPNKLDTLVGGTGSVMSELSNAYNGLKEMPLLLDEVYVYQGPTLEKTINPPIFKIFWEGVKRFIGSFRKQTFNVKDTRSKKVINVWVNRPRQYVDILQQLIDKEFTPKTGVFVNLSIMRDEQKLILSNAAKKSPDVALGISNWIPFEMGIRGAALDLTRFSDFKDFLINFHPGSLLPYFYEDHCYGLPETIDFYVLFYRKDIMNYLKIPVPQTWDDVKLILPELQRNGMNFYIPLGGSTSFKAWMTTAPFIMQYHGKLFTDDGLKTAIDSPETLRAFKEMTELFTMYGMPIQVANFFESFRKGEIPIGVSNITTYIQLNIAAPELTGRWTIVPSPGVRYGQVIERWQTGSAQAVTIFNDTKYPMETWKFIKWWLSKETQSAFVNQVVSTYGMEYLFIPSNRYVIDDVPLKREDLEAVKEQFKWLQEVPKMPASYVLEREISSIWNKVVLEGKVLRVAVDDAVTTINKEFARKLEEFGYYKDGKPVKSFKIYSLEDVLELYKKKSMEGAKR
ncbi:MAG: extracellular solute-binding protein [Fervidobacterium sp.]